MLQELAALVAAAGGGAAVLKGFELFFSERRQTKAERITELKQVLESDESIIGLVVSSIKEQRDSAFSEVRELNAKVDKLEMEIQGLRLAQNRDPFPRWIVGVDGRYLYINPCFEEHFLRPQHKHAQSIIGLTHEDFWPPEFSTKLHLLDEEAKRRPDGRAKATVLINGQQLTVYKLPIRHSTGAIVAYEGWITDIEQEAYIGRQ